MNYPVGSYITGCQGFTKVTGRVIICEPVDYEGAYKHKVKVTSPGPYYGHALWVKGAQPDKHETLREYFKNPQQNINVHIPVYNPNK